MENLQYGNWIRTRVLWFLCILTLILGVLVLLPVAVVFRVALGILALAALLSFLFPLYSYVMFSPRGGKLQDKFYSLILAHIADPGAGKIIDIGAGNGILAIQAARKFPFVEVTGVDYWGKDWEYSKSICEQNAALAKVDGRVHFQKGDAASLNFFDGSFDAVTSNLTFHEVKLVKDKSFVIREALRILKPGGSFAFIDYFYDERHYGETGAFELLLLGLDLKQVELKPLDKLLPFPALLRHPRALGKVGLLYGKK